MGKGAVTLRAESWRHGGAAVISEVCFRSGHRAPPQPACGSETRQSAAVCPPSPRHSLPRSTVGDQRAARCATRFPVPPLTVPPCALGSNAALVADRAGSIFLRSDLG